jgi:thymidylate synthase (FAD)
LKVILRSKTEPFTYTDDDPQTTEELISYTARVSNPVNQTNFETSEKLIQYLLKKSHVSPFEMVDLTMEIKTTRDIGRQILRHRSFSFQEFSQRYAEVEVCDDNMQVRECRLQDKHNRQNSIPTKDQFLEDRWNRMQWQVYDKAAAIYKEAISLDIAKEQARAVLPEGLTPSTMYMKGSLRSWFHYCLVRCHPGTQKEHREIAHECWRIIQDQFSFFRGLDIEKLSIRYQEMFETLLEECYDR